MTGNTLELYKANLIAQISIPNSAESFCRIENVAENLEKAPAEKRLELLKKYAEQTRKRIDIEEFIREQNWKPIDPEEFNRLVITKIELN